MWSACAADLHGLYGHQTELDSGVDVQLVVREALTHHTGEDARARTDVEHVDLLHGARVGHVRPRWREGASHRAHDERIHGLRGVRRAATLVGGGALLGAEAYGGGLVNGIGRMRSERGCHCGGGDGMAASKRVDEEENAAIG